MIVLATQTPGVVGGVGLAIVVLSPWLLYPLISRWVGEGSHD